MTKHLKTFGWWSALLTLAFATAALPIRAAAQDDQGDDPPTRVARLGYMEGSVSFQPAGEEEWVQAVSNRPMTTGDKIWSDKDSKAELQLGSSVIRLSENTGFSFLNLDDHTVQIQLTSGVLNLRVRRLDQGDAYEVDTPNLAFTVDGPGNYRLEASEDGTYTVVTLRDGQGEATGNGQTYTVHAGQRATFNGTDSLNADVEQLGQPDQFDTWGDGRDHRGENSRSARYLAPNVVGYEDLDDNGDWRDDSNYGHVWFPSHVEAGWAPYHEGHWDWISPWGYTWVDDSNWGYAPFHYGRWVSVGGRWGWIGGPVDQPAVYAPALVVFLGGGPGGFGGDVGWFPLGPREVYVPPYQVSAGYMNRVNISNTNVSTTVITNVYNTTIVNKSTTITNVTYANRGVQGAVTVVPQRAFAGAQPVAHNAVRMNAQQLASAPISAHVAVAPTRDSVLGAHASSAGHVSRPPAAVASRQVIAKRTPPPPPVSFAKQQQAMAAHPGQPVPHREMQSLRPAAQAHPMVKQAPPAKQAQLPAAHPAGQGNRPGQPAGNQQGNRPGQPPAANQQGNRPGQPPAANQQGNRPGQPPANERPGAANQPNRPGQPAANEPANRPGQAPANQPGNRPGQPAANERPGAAPQQHNDRPPSAQQPANRPNEPANRPNEPANRPGAQPPANERPGAANQPNRPNEPAARPNEPANRPGQPPANRPETNRPNEPAAKPEANRPPASQPNRPAEPAQNNRPAAQPNRPAEPPAQSHPAAQPNRPEPKPAQPEPKPAQPAARPTPPPAQHAPERTPPPAAKPAPPPAQHAPEHAPPPAVKPAPAPAPAHPPAKTPQEKKQEEDKKKPPAA